MSQFEPQFDGFWALAAGLGTMALMDELTEVPTELPIACGSDARPAAAGSVGW